MVSNNKISVPQLFCVLLLSRLSAEIVYPRTASAAAVEAISALIISELIRFALALPIIVYSFNGNNIHRAVWNKNRFFGWTGALFAAALLVGASLRTLFYSAEFSVKNLLIGGLMWAIFTISAIFAIYAAAMGAEAIARAGAIILIAAALVSITAMLADIPYMRVSAITGGGDFSSFLNEIFERLMRGGEYLIFAALLPYVEKKKPASAGKGILLFALFSTLAAAFICVFNCLVLREMYGLCEYPFIAASSLSDIAFFKRLDGAAASVWTLCAVFRGGLMLLAAESAIAEVYSAARHKRRQKSEGETL